MTQKETTNISSYLGSLGKYKLRLLRYYILACTFCCVGTECTQAQCEHWYQVG